MALRFSDRMGITKPPTTLQVGVMNDALRNSLWNHLITTILQDGDAFCHAVDRLAGLYLKLPLDAVPRTSYPAAQKWVRDVFFKADWYEVYNLLEFFAAHAYRISGEYHTRRDAFVIGLNDVLARELSGYRLIQGRIVEITNEAEIQAIDEAVTGATQAGLDGVRTHLVEALRLLGRKPEPDYRNAIKEAIGAVESAVSAVAGLTKPDLDGAIELLRGKGLIHGAMATAFTKLYGYTSDAGGIRHALLEGGERVGFDEAKFMVVACSAFANFLISKAQAAGLLKS